MASNGTNPGFEGHVTDEEGTVDTTVKQHILRLREAIDEDERELYVNLRARPDGITLAEADEYWAVSVRQYLRGIKRLWHGGERDGKSLPIRGVERYWEQKHIGTVSLDPPDKQGLQFSLGSRGDLSDTQVKRGIGLPASADVPRPKEIEFVGLSDVLNRKVVRATWSVTIDESGPPPTHERVQLQRTEPVPKHILEQAIEAADNWLQQAGIGFDTTTPDYEGGGDGL